MHESVYLGYYIRNILSQRIARARAPALARAKIRIARSERPVSFLDEIALVAAALFYSFISLFIYILFLLFFLFFYLSLKRPNSRTLLSNGHKKYGGFVLAFLSILEDHGRAFRLFRSFLAISPLSLLPSFSLDRSRGFDFRGNDQVLSTTRLCVCQ